MTSEENLNESDHYEVDLHYEALKVEDVCNNRNKGKKCRIVGYLQIFDGDFYLKNIITESGTPKEKILIDVDKIENILPAISPQGVQIFGEIIKRNSVQNRGSINKPDYNSTDRIYIRAEIIQYLTPSLVLKMYEIIEQIPR